MSKSVLVTGAAGGIGRATVRALAERGHLVYAGVRGADAELAALPGVRLLTLDVTDPESVAAAAEQVGPELHAVVNNAGVIVQGPLELVPPGELLRQFAVNTFGPVFVIQALLPKLRAGHGRIVNVSAPTAYLSMPMLGPLSASKAALESLSTALRTELAAWGIPVVMIVPGAAETAIFTKAEAAARTSLAAAGSRTSLYDAHLAALGKMSAGQKLAPVQPVADAVVAAVTARDPKRRYSIGGMARSAPLLARLPSGLRDRLIAGLMGLNGIKAGGV
jgi:NAD(P)-dependent dehydrogenase (short-subunit alcohol dehydrogenase family)